MNIAELIDQVELEISPILDIEQIEVSYARSKEGNKKGLTISITIFYTPSRDNFATTFYRHNPLPKTVKEIVTAIKEAMKEQNVPFKRTERKRPLNGIDQVEVL